MHISNHAAGSGLPSWSHGLGPQELRGSLLGQGGRLGVFIPPLAYEILGSPSPLCHCTAGICLQGCWGMFPTELPRECFSQSCCHLRLVITSGT